jgi:hypothetical protein
VRLSTLLFLILGIGSLAGTGWIVWRVTAEGREWDELLSYSGKDLQGAGLERIQALAGKLLRNSPAADPVRWVARLDGPQSRNRILLCQPLKESALLTLIDDGRRQIFSVEVRTGRWSQSIKSLRGNTRPEVSPWTFVVEQESGGATELAFQHYAVLDDRPALLRLERPSGESVPNDFQTGCPVGPSPPIFTPDEWERRLSSGTLAEMLEALHWLGGIHALKAETSLDAPAESPEQLRVFRETSRRPAVLLRIRQLARHAHPWIAHAAEQARNRLER